MSQSNQSGAFTGNSGNPSGAQGGGGGGVSLGNTGGFSSNDTYGSQEVQNNGGLSGFAQSIYGPGFQVQGPNANAFQDLTNQNLSNAQLFMQQGQGPNTQLQASQINQVNAAPVTGSISNLNNTANSQLALAQQYGGLQSQYQNLATNGSPLAAQQLQAAQNQVNNQQASAAASTSGSAAQRAAAQRQAQQGAGQAGAANAATAAATQSQIQMQGLQGVGSALGGQGGQLASAAGTQGNVVQANQNLYNTQQQTNTTQAQMNQAEQNQNVQNQLGFETLGQNATAAAVTPLQDYTTQSLQAQNQQATAQNQAQSQGSNFLGSMVSGLGSVIGGLFSDMRLKENVRDDTHLVDAFLDHISPLSYNFKNKNREPDPGVRGRYLGTSANSMQRVPSVGPHLVHDTPMGKEIQIKPVLSAALAGLARLNERVKELEGLKSNGRR